MLFDNFGASASICNTPGTPGVGDVTDNLSRLNYGNCLYWLRAWPAGDSERPRLFNLQSASIRSCDQRPGVIHWLRALEYILFEVAVIWFAAISAALRLCT